MFSIKEKTNMGCEFPIKYVSKPFNGTSRNEEHVNNFVQSPKRKSNFKENKEKTLTTKMTTKILSNIIKTLKTLLNMHATVVKHCVSHFKFILFLNYILANCLMIFKMKKWKTLYLYVIIVKQKMIVANNWTWFNVNISQIINWILNLFQSKIKLKNI